MSRKVPGAACLLLGLALLAGCKGEPQANESRASNDDAWNVTEIPADESAAANAPAGALVPPEPGEPGGLPDDRRPLDESAARDPASVAASGATIELFGLALADGRYDDAYRFWADGGRRSGMNEAQFAENYRKYSEIHVRVGRPEAQGNDAARVPVQIYGRLRENGSPFNLYGPITLERNPAGQRGEAGQPPWLITASALTLMGEVTVSQTGGDAQIPLIPAGFQGRWSDSAVTCARPGDTSRLTVKGDSLIFYESEGKVTRIRLLAPNEIRIEAHYTGEGEAWSRTSNLRLSAADDALTLDGKRRVRCMNAA